MVAGKINECWSGCVMQKWGRDVCCRISHEQVVALIYSMLKYIDRDSLKREDVIGWNELIGTLGHVFLPKWSAVAYF